MVDLRAKHEAALATTLEGDFSLPIKLIGPAGVIQNVRGQVIYYTTEFDPETGAEIRVEKPNCTLRRSSLSPVPANGESWAIYLPETPNEEADQIAYTMERATKNGNSFGFITLYCTSTDQVTP
jgi:hypothetical protein